MRRPDHTEGPGSRQGGTVDEEARLRPFLPTVGDVLGGTSAVGVLERVRVHSPHVDE